MRHSLPAALLAALPILASAQTPAPQHRAAWLRQAKWGVMTHYLADWQTRVNHLELNVGQWNQMVDGFDAKGIAAQLDSVKAGYYLISIGQNSGYYIAPNPVYDKLTGTTQGHCARRDLVSDLAAALGPHGIPLMVYLPSGAPAGDKAAMAALEWRNGPYPNREFQVKWQAVIREWAQRWGKKVAGWWFDGCYFPSSMYRDAAEPNFGSFAAAARAGNPASIVTFNPGVVYRLLSLTPHEDYTAGEIDKPEMLTIRRSQDGLVDGVQIHVLSYLGETWGKGEPRFTTEQAVAFTRKVIDAGGAITWDVPVTIGGRISQAFLDQLMAIGKAAGSQR